MNKNFLIKKDIAQIPFFTPHHTTPHHTTPTQKPTHIASHLENTTTNRLHTSNHIIPDVQNSTKPTTIKHN